MFACMNLNVPLKRMTRFPFVKSCYDMLYNVLYKYSHHKVIKLIQFSPFGRIFKHFNENGSMKEMFSEDDIFLANPESYLKNLDVLLKTLKL